MKRIETLVKEGRADLKAHEYRTFLRNGVGPMDVARALDQIKAAERTLRQAYDIDGLFDKQDAA